MNGRDLSLLILCVSLPLGCKKDETAGDAKSEPKVEVKAGDPKTEAPADAPTNAAGDAPPTTRTATDCRNETRTATDSGTGRGWLRSLERDADLHG